MAGLPRAFYVQAWMTKATYLISALQLVGAALLLAFGSEIAVGPVIPAMFLVGAALTAYQAYWTTRTPIAVIEADAVTVRHAMLAKSRRLRFADVRAFARVPPGVLVLLSRDGDETRLPLTALSDADAQALVALLREHLTEVSYVES